MFALHAPVGHLQLVWAHGLVVLHVHLGLLTQILGYRQRAHHVHLVPRGLLLALHHRLVVYSRPLHHFNQQIGRAHV